MRIFLTFLPDQLALGTGGALVDECECGKCQLCELGAGRAFVLWLDFLMLHLALVFPLGNGGRPA